MSRDWVDYLADARDAYDRIHGPTATSGHPGSSVHIALLRRALLDVRADIADFDDLTWRSTYLIQTKGKYPYGEGSDSEVHLC